MRIAKYITVVIAAVVLAAGAGMAFAAWLIAPAVVAIGPPPRDFPAEQVAISSSSGGTLAGWFARGQPGAGAVLLLHGVRANRLSMLTRAQFLHRHGYSVLLIDFQASGESPGRQITFGLLEAHDARAAFDALKQRTPAERVGVIGVSMGGAAVLLSDPPIKADALVFEAVYATFEAATENRLKLYLGPLGSWLLPAAMKQVKPRLGVDPALLRPIDRLDAFNAPTLFIAGAADRHVSRAETQRLFDRAPGAKDLWIIAGAAHVDFHEFAKDAYETRLLSFLSPHLKR